MYATLEDLLPHKQKLLFIYLAENSPQTINEIKKGVKGDYKATWTSLNELKDKKLIQPLTKKIYHNVEYDRYWITETGIFTALCEGVNAHKLLRKAKEFYPNKQNIHLLIEILPILGIKGFDTLCLAIINKGKIEQNDINALMVAQAQDKLSADEKRNLIEIMKKNPRVYASFKIDFQKRLKNLEEFKQALGENKTKNTLGITPPQTSTTRVESRTLPI